VTGAERELLEESVVRAADAIEVIATDGIDAAMARYNARA
jgi:PTH1 family peptidyl-tRNA hydrolase